MQILQRIFQESKEKVELHEKRLLITFWKDELESLREPILLS